MYIWMGVVIPHADSFLEWKCITSASDNEGKELRRVEWNEELPKRHIKKLWNYCCFFFYFSSFYPNTSVDWTVKSSTKHQSCGVWREQLLPSLRLNHIAYTISNTICASWVLTRIIKERASAELSQQNRQMKRKRKRRGHWMEDSSFHHLPACAFDKYYITWDTWSYQNKILFKTKVGAGVICMLIESID